MNTVQKNKNITKKQVQELLENNQKKLGLSDKRIRKLIKSIERGCNENFAQYYHK